MARTSREERNMERARLAYLGEPRDSFVMRLLDDAEDADRQKRNELFSGDYRLIPDEAFILTRREWENNSRALSPKGKGYWSDGLLYNVEKSCFGPAPDWATHVVWFSPD